MMCELYAMVGLSRHLIVEKKKMSFEKIFRGLFIFIAVASSITFFCFSRLLSRNIRDIL